jgi:endonuclease G, mitochondrial
MAVFRPNHTRAGRGSSMGYLIRGMLMLMLLVGLLSAPWLCTKMDSTGDGEIPREEREIFADYLPLFTEEGVLVKHPYHTLFYSSAQGQPLWVAYELTLTQLNRVPLEASFQFKKDSSFNPGSRSPWKFQDLAYSMAQLLPPSHRAWDSLAMQTTFLMSNVCPQEIEFNAGIWREVENQVGEWVNEFNHLYVVAGPVLQNHNLYEPKDPKSIAIPDAFFKALLRIDNQGMGESLALLIPHPLARGPLDAYCVSIDSLERLLGWDFFPGITNNEHQQEGRVNKTWFTKPLGH